MFSLNNLARKGLLLLSSKFYWTDNCKIMHMSWQLYCYGMSKIL